MEELKTLPETAPIMPLTGALLFPHALLPLYIFESRYRAMLEHALARERMFCVTLIRPEIGQWQTEEDFFEIATVGLIRACVGRADGTSNLILQGLQRVRLCRFAQLQPFPIAHLVALKSEPNISIETEALGAKVLELYDRFKKIGRQLPAKVDSYLSDLSDLAMLADLMAATFIVDPLRRQEVLEALDLNRRLRLVIQYLSEEPSDAAA